MKCFLMIFLGCALVGCVGTPVYTSVTRFTTLPTPVMQPRTVAIWEVPKSLEEATHQRLIYAEFAKYGWQRAPLPQADYVAFYAASIDNGVYQSSQKPIFGVTGGGTSTTTGTVNSYSGRSANFQATTYQPLTFGQVGSVNTSGYVYRRVMFFKVLDRQTKATVYEGKAFSEGSTSDLGPILPCMIQAMFKVFPGKNGTTNTVMVPLQ